MSKFYEIVQYGMGGVGRALFGLVVQHAPEIKERLGINLRYRAIVDSTHALHIDLNSAMNQQYMQYLWARLKPEVGERISEQTGAVQKPSELSILATELDRIRSEDSAAKLVVVDTSGASDSAMTPVLTSALRQGHCAVLANKRPLCGPIEDFRQMASASGLGMARLRYETTAGAALPVVSTLRMLLDSFDQINEISGCFSGTLGYLATELENGRKYSEIVADAKAQGYTEPDPRDDLGGVDVARKALILARSLGMGIELSEVTVEALYPDSLSSLSVPEFMARLPEVDEYYAGLAAKAAEKGETLRYIAIVSGKGLTVGLQSVPKDSQIGRLRGTDNIVVFKTRRYDPNPMVIQGRGAGPEVTASGVLADIISFGR
ncbi:MAG: homoserine dehydrogenase [Chloroflexi bacterium]|uniref:Homoserine dehydrogenase n=1 Tax=Candidatus Chlorohelix allophototropha TaxID=3003348 RepID=A0A8T7LZ79_9CHLR|nr:homoserine dehydrogenase [Chloroflexota bacterium]WJW65678.1 homoserine dehydrogenase [Chloroflexota bacterium L227-S17]